ncbi:MAG: hypothetical protein ACLFU9_08120 [Candidatus Bathyarchaeia archaeon]
MWKVIKERIRQVFVSLATAVTLGFLDFFALLTAKPEDMSKRAKKILSLGMVGVWLCVLVLISWINIELGSVSDTLSISFIWFSLLVGLCLAWLWSK